VGQPVDEGLLRRMASTIAHRGPDATGVYAEGTLGLAQTRLSIIGLGDEGNPPLSNEDGTVWVVFNGEIYNFRELRTVLEGRGHVFRSNTDTEVIVHAYEEYGYDCVKRFIGMFAFAVWDSRKRMLFAARDRLGQKPFTFAQTEGGFWFASEAKAMLADPECPREADFGAIDVYLREGYIPSPLSAFKCVSRLRPGAFLTCSEDGVVDIRTYWEPPYPSDDYVDLRDYGEAKAMLKEMFLKAVERRLVADVPLGVFLSGGLDSGVLVAAMAQLMSEPVKTFSVGFEEASHNELPYARQVAERYGTEHQEFVVKMDSVDVLPKLVWHYNEPFADSSSLPTYYVSKMTSAHVKVALTGDGGDENFAGYYRYERIRRFLEYSNRVPGLQRFSNFVRQPLMGGRSGNFGARLERALGLVSEDLPERYRIMKTAGLKDAEKARLYARSFWDRLEGGEVYREMWNPGSPPRTDPVAWMMHHDQKYYLPDDLQVKADIASMANGLELRSPMLDQEFVELCARMPVSWKLREGAGKAIFRDVFGSWLPEAVLNKPKTGFRIPLAKWLKSGWKELMVDTLTSSRAQGRGLFDQRIVEKMISEHIGGRRDWGRRLWLLICLELWFVEFIDRRD